MDGSKHAVKHICTSSGKATLEHSANLQRINAASEETWRKTSAPANLSQCGGLSETGKGCGKGRRENPEQGNMRGEICLLGSVETCNNNIAGLVLS